MDWLTILEKVFEVLVFPVLIALAGYVVSLIHSKKEELKAKAKDETTKKYIDLLDKTISECVLATTQTYVETLKKEGKFDEAAQKKAFTLTFDAVIDILTDDAQIYLNEAFKDLTAYITNKIEAEVKKSK